MPSSPGPAVPPAEPPTAGRADEAGWLSEDEMAAWLPLLRILLQLPQELDRQLRETAGLNHAHYTVLSILSAQPDRTMPMSDLSRTSSLSLSRLSHAVSSMEARGWISRTPSPRNRRVQHVQLTGAGAAMLDAVAPGHVREVRRLVFDRLTDNDVADLRRVGLKVLAALDG